MVLCTDNSVFMLSKENTQSIKGLSAIMVLFSPLSTSLSFGNRYLTVFLASFGYLACATFFFLSGYGLEISFSKVDYHKSFFKNKIVPYFIIYLIIALTYFCYHLAIGNSTTFNLILRTFSFGDTFIANGWYLQVQFYLYVLFWIVYLLFSNRRSVRICCIFAVLICYCIICYCCRISEFWYISIISFPIGCCFAGNRNKSKVIIRFFAAVLFVITYLATYLIGNTLLRTILYIFSSSSFSVALSFIVMLRWLKPILSVFKMLSTYSFGIYVMQGLAIDFFAKNIIGIVPSFKYALCVIIVTFIISIPFTIMQRKVYDIFRSYDKKKQYN